jgi:tetratricopeptide (TPR) repeat protein
VELAGAAWEWALGRGYVQEWRTRLEELLVSHAASPAKRAVMLGLAHLSQAAADFERTMDLLHEAIPLFESAGDSRAVAACTNGIALTLAGLGRYEEARPHLERARELTDDADARAAIDQNLANLLVLLGDYAEARRIAEASLADDEATGHLERMAYSHAALAFATAALGESSASDHHYTEAVRLGFEVIDLYLVQASLRSIALGRQGAAPLDAAFCIGAAETIAEGAGYALPPNEADEWDSLVSSVAAALGAAAFARERLLGADAAADADAVMSRLR